MNELVRQGDLDVASLVAAFAERPTEERLRMVGFLAGYGRERPYNEARAGAVAALVQLCSDPDPEVYREAASMLAHRVPDLLVRDHAAAVMHVIEEHREDDTSAWLAAKLGSARGRRLVRERRVAPRMAPVERDLVLGLLGDAEAERRSVDRYHAAMDPEGDLDETGTWTGNMARMGTPAAVLALARDLRHPGVYTTTNRMRFVVRAEVVSALAYIYPQEPALHQDLTSSEHYARIEEWAEQQLGLTFSEPRPPHVSVRPGPKYPPPRASADAR
jgi:hypothetical protein